METITHMFIKNSVGSSSFPRAEEIASHCSCDDFLNVVGSSYHRQFQEKKPTEV